MIIAISQRVDVVESYKERRDCLDQRWFDLLNECGITAIPIPNNLKNAEAILNSVKFDGIILTGGGDLVSYGGSSPERDETERYLLKYALSKNLPLLGVCRGMQVIQDYYGVSLEKVENHIACSHRISLENNFEVVNSYHAWGAKKSNDDLIVLGKADDDVIEAIKHKTLKLKGIMWHPERNANFTSLDKGIITNFFKK